MRTVFARTCDMAANTTGQRRLSREKIVTATRELADNGGLPAVTLRAVAAALGTSQASLYRHIADRDQLLDLLADDLAAGFPLVSREPVTVDVVAAQWRGMHDHLTPHQWAAPLLVAGTHLARGAEHITRHAIQQLERTGLAPEAATRTYRALCLLLLGHLLNSHPFGHGHEVVTDADDDPATFEWALRCLLPGALANE